MKKYGFTVSKDDRRRVNAALEYFSKTPTEEIEELAKCPYVSKAEYYSIPAADLEPVDEPDKNSEG